MGNPSLNHRYRKGFYSLFKTLQQNHQMSQSESEMYPLGCLNMGLAHGLAGAVSYTHLD
ncbi:lanthionine synthetase LanC family protein, partial [Klebsiella pneumoniae]|uniref:lanthionine synthetase LanC family protein n=1 Tax=Klebsiella pneumoniae TaxID=573 RepID=UPI00332578EC